MQHLNHLKFISVQSKYSDFMIKYFKLNIVTYYRFEANFGQQTVVFTFKCGGLAELAHGQARVARKGNRMEVIV